MNGSGNPAKKGMDLRLQYILSLLTGPLLLAIGGTSAVLFTVRYMGDRLALPVLSFDLLLLSGTVLPFLLGIVSTFLLYPRSEQKRTRIYLVTAIAVPALQVLFALFFLILSFLPPVLRILCGGEEMLSWLSGALRISALQTLLYTAVFTAAAALVGFLWKKKTLLFVLIVFFAAFVLSMLLMYVFVFSLNFGLTGFVIGYGLLQPAAVVLPNVGRWKAPVKEP